MELDAKKTSETLVEGKVVAAAFDISDYELEDVAVLVVQNAKGTGDLIGADRINPVTIEAYSSGSKQHVRALHRAGQQAQARVALMVRGKTDPKAAEKADQEQVDKLVECTRRINNFPISPVDLYSNPKLGYITKQFARFLEDDSNFAKALPDSLASTSGSELG